MIFTPEVPKYATLAELARAVSEGDCKGTLTIDNDSVSMYDEASDRTLFDAYPEDVMTQALDLLGIRWEHV